MRKLVGSINSTGTTNTPSSSSPSGVMQHDAGCAAGLRGAGHRHAVAVMNTAEGSIVAERRSDSRGRLRERRRRFRHDLDAGLRASRHTAPALRRRIAGSPTRAGRRGPARASAERDGLVTDDDVDRRSAARSEYARRSVAPIRSRTNDPDSVRARDRAGQPVRLADEARHEGGRRAAIDILRRSRTAA